MFIHVSAIPPLSISCDARHGSKRRLPWFYLELAGKLFLQYQPLLRVCYACQCENKQMFIFCLWLLRMMDYSAQIAVIIGKPLTFRHYPYPCSRYNTLDMGFTVYWEHMLSRINVCLNPLVLPSGYLYPIFIFILISLIPSFSSAPRCMGSL